MTTEQEIVVLQSTDLPPPAEALLSGRFKLFRIADDGQERTAWLQSQGSRVRAIAGSGKGIVDTTLLTALPNLEIISVMSAGLDGIDTEAVARRSIPIFNTSGVLADDVADLALWLILGTTRGLVEADRFVRSGDWTATNSYPLGKTIAGMNIGILGLGHIGRSVARRVELLGGSVGYTGRNRQPEVSFPYLPDVKSLASWSDLLVVCCPSTAATHHLVDRDVLKALGSSGILVNIARGNIVDESALVDALNNHELFAAGLDVFEGEPHVPSALLNSSRAIVLPHIGSATTGTRSRMWQSMVDSLIHHFALKSVNWQIGE